MKFRKKPVVVDAMQNLRTARTEIAKWIGPDHSGFRLDGLFVINRPTYNIHVHEGYWILKHADGLIETCKPDYFEKNYEEIEE